MPNIYIGSDSNVTYSGAKSATTGDYLNTGTCTYSLKDGSGTEIDSGTLTYIAASNGNYLGVIDATVTATLKADSFYNLVISFSQDGYDDTRTLSCRAAVRGSM